MSTLNFALVLAGIEPAEPPNSSDAEQSLFGVTSIIGPESGSV
jgi:hypothetical protein